MNLLFTGASGFLGNNIKPILETNYNIVTIGLGATDDIVVNLAQDIPNLKDSYDVVLHAAGKAHSIPKTEADKKVFFDVNYQGTVNLCKGLEISGVPKSFIFVSTVAVYGCDYGINISEEHPLLGETPYAQSKIMAENFLQQWCYENKVVLSIIRPSLIAGPNPSGNLKSMIDGINTGRYLSINGGVARKSVLMVQDIAYLLPLLIEKGGIYNVCDNHHPSFKELELLISRQLGKKKPFSIPYFFARIMAMCGDLLGENAPINSAKLDKIVKSLTFNNSKAVNVLGWKPLNVLENFRVK